MPSNLANKKNDLEKLRIKDLKLAAKIDAEETAKEKQKCTICKNNFNGFGNNAEPVKKGSCCNICNTLYVIPKRLKEWNNTQRIKNK